ncbi:unnamed protein product [Mesocestoides corti]|uniref:LRRCT domain-containing protein n=1 Tax=Mesocestoides corti TaxID=53468 RepID=A0A0R3UDZ0_MESCO|nr:unnamed protein product [Mesocestoides corti]
MIPILLCLFLVAPNFGDRNSGLTRGLQTRPADALCPSYCECLREETTDGTPMYSAECHVATNTLPILCARRWISLKLNLYNYSAPLQQATFEAKPLFSYCHELASLYIRQTGDNPVGFTFRSILQGLVNLRRIWLHHVQVETDGFDASSFYKVPPNLELIAFSDCHLNLDTRKPLFFDTPTSLRQLRLTNISLTGSFSKYLLVNLCHTSTGASRPNDLVSLYLDRNYLKGLTRDSLVGCRHLRVLQLSYNQLSGSLEEVMGLSPRILRQNWTFKKTLSAAETIEYGVLGYTPQLQALDLSGNFISGIRSPLWAYGRDGSKIRSLLELKTISLSNNNLTFIVRGAFQGAPNLREIDLSRNPKLFCPMHLESPTFYSYIDPYIFGGVEKLKKVYWDFSDKTCILSSMMSESSYGILSEGLFSLFASRALCLTEVTRQPVTNRQLALAGITTSATPFVIRNKLSATEHSIEMEGSTSSWALIDIASSFLCCLMALLLIVLFIVLAIRSKTVYETLSNCCKKGKRAAPLSLADQQPLDEPRRPQGGPCYTFPAGNGRAGVLLLHEEREGRLNNGLRSSSLQNLCLACLEQTPVNSASSANTQHLEFYDNNKHLTTSFLEGVTTQPPRVSGAEITQVIIESHERPADEKYNVHEWNFV